MSAATATCARCPWQFVGISGKAAAEALAFHMRDRHALHPTENERKALTPFQFGK